MHAEAKNAKKRLKIRRNVSTNFFQPGTIKPTCDALSNSDSDYKYTKNKPGYALMHNRTGILF